MKNEFEYDLSTMIPLEMPRNNRNPGMQFRISEKNRMSMNKNLFEDVKKRNPTLQIRFLYRNDLKVIVLENKSNTKEFIKFHADGSIVHPDFVKELRVKGYKIPAMYIVKWIEDKNAWIGVLQNEVPELSDAKKTVKKAISKNKSSKRSR